MRIWVCIQTTDGIMGSVAQECFNKELWPSLKVLPEVRLAKKNAEAYDQLEETITKEWLHNAIDRPSGANAPLQPPRLFLPGPALIPEQQHQDENHPSWPKVCSSQERFSYGMVMNCIITTPDGNASVEAAVQAMETYIDVTDKIEQNFVAGMVVPPSALLCRKTCCFRAHWQQLKPN